VSACRRKDGLHTLELPGQKTRQGGKAFADPVNADPANADPPTRFPCGPNGRIQNLVARTEVPG
jgi:hypothetical protein